MTGSGSAPPCSSSPWSGATPGESHHREQQTEHAEVEAFLQAYEAASIADKCRMLRELRPSGKAGQSHISKRERKELRKVHREHVVKRSVMMRVIAAWIITVPASTLMAALLFYLIRGALAG